jgi:energy-coupling factor transport system permease protein
MAESIKPPADRGISAKEPCFTGSETGGHTPDGLWKGDWFAGYHPVVNILYFGLVMTCAMFFTHPVCLILSLLGALAYDVSMNGKRALKRYLKYMLPMLLVTALMNPAFNHQGETILFYFESGNPLTLESVVYGAAAAVTLITVIIWFACFNEVMTSDKMMYLFVRLIPALSLTLSMALRFAPRFRARIQVISNAQSCIGGGYSGGGVLRRAGNGVKILSIMITWTLENAIETAGSMKSRGYGLPGRTAFSVFRFDRRDRRVLAFILVCGAYIAAGAFTGGLYFRYFPAVTGAWGGIYPISLFAVYLVLCLMPVIINVRENHRWKTLRKVIVSKI